MFLKKKRCVILIGLIVILTELSCSNNNIGFNSANIVPLIDNLSHEKVILEFSKFPYESDAYYGFPKTEKISKDNLISFNFTDEKSVLNISDDELRMIAWQDYHTSDFFSQGTFSFFEFQDCPLLKFGDYPFGDEYGELLYDEEVYTYLFNDKIEKMDLNNPYPLEDAKDYINKELEQTLRPYGDEIMIRPKMKAFK